MSETSGRSNSKLSDSSSVSEQQTADLSIFSGSFDGGVFSSNIPMFNFAGQGSQSALYSPHPFVKSNDPCRLTALTQSTPKEPMNLTPADFGLADFSVGSESFADFSANNSSFVGNFQSNVRSTRLLPAWAVDASGNIRDDLTLLSIQKFDESNAMKLVEKISNLDFLPLCTDQCAIHVLQKVVKILPVSAWSFFVKFLCRDDNLMTVCQDKYGCRLVQQTIDKLSDNPKSPCFNTRLQLLHGLMTSVARNCFRLSSNEFANYVVQYVIKSSGVMEMYRDTIIEKCLLRNILSMSQDKYASHVIEGAFLFAPPHLLSEMMEEIFDGYVKDQETNRDALDILLFHQYGNYVIQQMISICISALLGKEERKMLPTEMRLYAKWFDRIKNRVNRHSSRLERFSSGKKIIESLQKLSVPMTMTNEPMPLWAVPTPLMDITAQFLNRQNFQKQHSVFDD
ncbi:Protein CBR-PUF-5 [Caenorhabditis briggsae]|uniref:Protein CBR-PUF-5 n=1 Tax=Caenorhabditis briggsae TaxID=6238 RepID=A8WNC5_CAEBR|nr:Protein CBR-PUF-5 [Caenorhabditis briggsae]CAP21979.2 Protein CBR-PUF-5 [Caenorhabditis briggsae]